jgi:hypothetical protein
MSRSIVIGGILAIAVTAAAGGYYWYASRDKILSEVPTRSGSSVTLPVRESNLAIRVAVPYAVLGQTLNDKIPSAFTGNGTGSDVCKKIVLARVCVGTKYDYAVSKVRELALSKAGDQVHAEMGIEANGHGGFRGDGARLLGLDAKSFRAAADVWVNLGIKLGPDWCPVASAEAGYNWTLSPQVEIVDGVWIGIAGIVNGVLQKEIDKLPETLASALPCNLVKKAAEKYWHRYDIPISIEGTAPLHLLINPSAIGTSGVVADDHEIRLVVAMTSQIEVSTSSPPDQPQFPLPRLGAAPDAPGHLAVSLPIHADYALLASEIMRVIGNKDLSFKVAGHDATATVRKVDIYPSNSDIAIGISFTAKLPGYLFDVSGMAYATAKPIVDASGMKIRFENFSYARTLDNQLWSAISAFFEDQIRQTIEQKGEIDLTTKINDAMTRLQEAIADPAKTKGVQIRLGSPRVRLEAVVPEENVLTVVVDADGTLDTTITSLDGLK